MLHIVALKKLVISEVFNQSAVTTQMGFVYRNCNQITLLSPQEKLNSKVFWVLLSAVPMVMGVA